MTQFYDSTRPNLIPDRDFAILYRDGLYGATGLASAHLFKHVRWITVTGDFHNCGIADYEPGNPDYYIPGRLRSYVLGRIKIQKRGRVYTNRSDIGSAVQELQGIDHRFIHWFIATLDGIDWTAGQLAENILQQFHVNIDPNMIWANQNYHDPDDRFDRSNLYRSW